jgi:DNA polymerase III delta subunit
MANLHVIIGEDDYLVSEAAKRVIGDGGGLEVIDSLNSTNAELQLSDLREADASFSTPPFLDPFKVTWWKNVGFLPQSGKSAQSEEVKAALEKFARKLASSQLPENQHFILSGPRLLMTSVFAKTLKTVADVVSFAPGKPWEAVKNAVVRVIDSAAEMNLKFSSGAAEAFVARVGTDSRSLFSELNKMRDYLGSGRHTVTAEDVAEISSQGVGVEPEVWAVTDAIGSRKVDAAMDALSRFEGENGFAIIMTNAIERFFRQLVKLKDAQERGFFDKATEGMAPFAVKKNAGFLRNWTLRELRIARLRFVKLREKAVSSSASVDALVAAEVVRTLRRSTANGRTGQR